MSRSIAASILSSAVVCLTLLTSFAAAQPLPEFNPPTPEQLPTQELVARAEKGDANAQFLLGRRYARGEGVKTDITQTVKWCQPSAAHGDAGGQYCMAFLYANGLGISSDVEEAFRLAK